MEQILLHIPEEEALILLSEGTGANLDYEDIQNGYVDYVNLDRYDENKDEYLKNQAEYLGEPTDGGLILLKEPYEKVLSTEQGKTWIIKEAIEYMIGKRDASYALLPVREEVPICQA